MYYDDIGSAKAGSTVPCIQENPQAMLTMIKFPMKVESTEDSVARKSCILSVYINAGLAERGRRLKKAGFDVDRTWSFESAMKKCSSGNIDLVISDECLLAGASKGRSLSEHNPKDYGTFLLIAFKVA